MPRIKFVPYLMASTLFTTMAMAVPTHSEEDLGAEVLGGYHYDGATVEPKITRDHRDGRTISANDPFWVHNHQGNNLPLF